MFAAAHALLDNGVADESAVLGTLAFAWSKGVWAADPDDFGVLEFLATADGIPVLRLPDITADVITYYDSRVPKAVRIDVYSRLVTSVRLASTGPQASWPPVHSSQWIMWSSRSAW